MITIRLGMLLCGCSWWESLADFLFSKDAFQNYVSEALGVFVLGWLATEWWKRQERKKLKGTRDFAYKELFDCVSDFLSETLPSEYSGDFRSYRFGKYYVPARIYSGDIDEHRLHRLLEEQWKGELESVKWFHDAGRTKRVEWIDHRLGRVLRFQSDLDGVLLRWEVLNELKTANSIAEIHDGLGFIARNLKVESVLSDMEASPWITLATSLARVQIAARSIQSELLQSAERHTSDPFNQPGVS